jgi:hypothetical protein
VTWGKSRREEEKWLREHGHAYAGQWVAEWAGKVCFETSNIADLAALKAALEAPPSA